MRSGTPGFIGPRLKEALEARCLSMVALAELAEISPSAVSQYVKGDSTPSLEVLDRICNALNLPRHFFTRPINQGLSDTPIFFRSFSSATASTRKRMRHRTTWLVEITRFIRRYVHIPPVQFPESVQFDHPSEISSDFIERCADKLRECWGLGDYPVSNVLWLLESKGFLISRSILSEESIDAFSFWPSAEENPFILLGADKMSACRSRFDAAHELGHIILHRHLRPEVIKAEHKAIESQAHRFAGAFLLPESRFSSELASLSLDGFLVLKTRWKVSVQAMIMRAKHLRLINEDKATNLYKNLSKRWGGRKIEPYDMEIRVESPQFLSTAMAAILDAEIVDRQQLRSIFDYSLSDVESLLGVAPKFLTMGPPKPQLIDVSDSA